MARPLWVVKIAEMLFPGRFLMARLSRLPGLGRLIRRLFFKGDAMVYLPAERVIRLNRPLESPQNVVLPTEVLNHFIEQARFHWVMNFCICREAAGCRDYPIELGCLFMGEAARDIHPGLGRPVTKSEALAHARRCREAGLVHLIGRNKLDTVWLGVGPGERLLTVCHCCPCCCLWRMLPHLKDDIRQAVTRMPGVSVRVTERCTGCGRCTAGVCFVNAISLKSGRASISAACRGCGRCVAQCPEGAIELDFRSPDSVEQAIRRLSPLIDLS